MDKKVFFNKKVLVMGLGRFGGGVDAAEFLHTTGAKTVVTDLAPADKLKESLEQLKKYHEIEYHLGSHRTEDFENSDIIVVNPAVPNNNKFLDIARRHNKFITSQINIFFELCPSKIIGITGSNGKSTTAALTAHLLKAGLKQQDCRYRSAWLSGNIGNEPLLMLLEKISVNDLVVLELSSFQLEQLEQIKKSPYMSLLTNLMPNHLDRYGTFENYCDAKKNIFMHQQLNESNPAVSIFNADDKVSLQWYEKYKNDKGRMCIRFSPESVSTDITEELTLPGRVNLSNLAGALAIATYFGVTEESVKKHLRNFKALSHRLELVEEINDVKWYNDSKATTPQSTIAALEAFGQLIIIIAGGYDKNLNFDELGDKITQSTKAAILLGQTAGKIKESIEKSAIKNPGKKVKIEVCNSLAKAVNAAKTLAVKGDVVLLSPACASYDMFENFQQRGKEFTKLVRTFKQ